MALKTPGKRRKTPSGSLSQHDQCYIWDLYVCFHVSPFHILMNFLIWGDTTGTRNLLFFFFSNGENVQAKFNGLTDSLSLMSYPMIRTETSLNPFYFIFRSPFYSHSLKRLNYDTGALSGEILK